MIYYNQAAAIESNQYFLPLTVESVSRMFSFSCLSSFLSSDDSSTLELIFTIPSERVAMLVLVLLVLVLLMMVVLMTSCSQHKTIQPRRHFEQEQQQKTRRTKISFTFQKRKRTRTNCKFFFQCHAAEEDNFESRQ